MIKSRRLRWAGHLARMEEHRSVYIILTRKPLRKRSFGKTRRRWEDNIRMDLREIYANTRNWVDSAHDINYREVIVTTALNLWVP